MANILPETEVEGSIISHIHRLTMVHIIYTIDTTCFCLHKACKYRAR